MEKNQLSKSLEAGKSVSWFLHWQQGTPHLLLSEAHQLIDLGTSEHLRLTDTN